MAVNYASYGPTVDPLKMAMGGFDLANQIKSRQENDLKMQVYMQQLNRKEDMQQALAGLRGTRDPQAYQDVLLQYPEIGDALNESISLLSDEQKDVQGFRSMQIANLIESGNVELAKSELDKDIIAAKNSGSPMLAGLQAQRDLLDADAKGVQAARDTFAFKALGKEKYAEYLEKQQEMAHKREMQPFLKQEQIAKAKQAEAEADKAAQAARFFEAEKITEIINNGGDPAFFASDPNISKDNLKIATKMAAAKKAKDAKTQQKLNLEIAAMEQERDDKIAAKQAEVTQANFTFDETLKDIATIRKLGNTRVNSALAAFGGVGGVIASVIAGDKTVLDAATGVLESQLPTLSQDVADFEEAVQRLSNKNFLQAFQSLKGGGPITDIEGQKAQNAATNLSLRQSSERFLANLKDLESSVKWAKNFSSKKAGLNYQSIENPTAAGIADTAVRQATQPATSGNFVLRSVRRKEGQ